MARKAKKLEDMKPKFQGKVRGFYPSYIDHLNTMLDKIHLTKDNNAVDSDPNSGEPIYFGAKPNQNIFQEGEQLMNGDRDKSYGDFHQNFANIAKSWSLVLGIEVTPHQFGLCMAIMKIIREAYSHKRDNLVDGAVYLRMANEIMERAENEKQS